MGRSRAAGETLDRVSLQAPELPPEVQGMVRIVTAKQHGDWIHQEIPALDGLTPMEAVKEKGGRDKVKALLT